MSRFLRFEAQRRGRRDRRDLLALLREELPADREAALRSRLEQDEELRRELDRLQRVWRSIADLPATDPPVDLSARVLAAVATQRAQGVSVLPAGARLAATLALLLGAALGMGVGQRLHDRPAESAAAAGLDQVFGLQEGLAGSLYPELESGSGTAVDAVVEDPP